MKGFIEVTCLYGFGELPTLAHYTQLYFMEDVCYFKGFHVKESYEEIKELIKQAQ